MCVCDGRRSAVSRMRDFTLNGIKLNLMEFSLIASLFTPLFLCCVCVCECDVGTDG